NASAQGRASRRICWTLFMSRGRLRGLPNRSQLFATASAAMNPLPSPLSEESKNRLKRWRTISIVGIYLLVAAIGIYGPLTKWQADPIMALMAISWVFCLVGTCAIDSQLRGAPLDDTSRWGMVWLWPVAVPGYMIWSRGRRGLLLLLAFAAAFVAEAFIIFA